MSPPPNLIPTLEEVLLCFTWPTVTAMSAVTSTKQKAASQEEQRLYPLFRGVGFHHPIPILTLQPTLLEQQMMCCPQGTVQNYQPPQPPVTWQIPFFLAEVKTEPAIIEKLQRIHKIMEHGGQLAWCKKQCTSCREITCSSRCEVSGVRQREDLVAVKHSSVL
ncbi:hypothetical protein FKP32DRAFT_1605326 [Trametes sanguinea]|nr:hypothetical protein FKP32DRAFT_1605326 [Trametes sanguinea]